MWIVRLALRRPYTFVVAALVILILGPFTILRTPTDIFPNINIPVVSIIWNYAGLSAEEMNNRIVSITERSLTTTVDNIEHIESQSLNGIAVVKVFFQPHANINKAIAQVTAISQTQLRQLPPGTTPPLVITYSASSVPIIQLALSGQKMSEQQLFDLGVNFIRTRLVTVPGVAIPWPYGGKQRQIEVDFTTPSMEARTKSDWSANSWICSSGGRPPWILGSICLMPAMMSSVEALPVFSTVSREARLPSTRTILVCGGNPSRT